MDTTVNYRVFHLRMCFFKGLKMPDNQHVDKKKRHWHIHKASPFDSQQLEWILNVEAGLHSLQQKIFQIQLLYLLFCSIVLMKKIDSICHQITEISIQMTCEAFKGLKNHIHHDKFTGFNDFSDSYCLKKPTFFFVLHTEWFHYHLNLLQPQWPQQPHPPQRLHWPP